MMKLCVSGVTVEARSLHSLSDSLVGCDGTQETRRYEPLPQQPAYFFDGVHMYVVVTFARNFSGAAKASKE